jgi:hypothetical protein
VSKYVKNTHATETQSWVGQDIDAGEYFLIETNKLHRWQQDTAFLIDLASGLAVIASANDSNEDITDYSAALNYLNNTIVEERDSDGASLSRTKVTQTGWQFHLQGVEFATSTLASIVNKDKDGDDLGFSTIKLYDDEDTEITVQATADTECVKTVVDWEPTFDYEVIGGAIKMTQDTTEDIYVYVIAVPDLTPAQGGSKNFVCCVNMKFIKGGDEVKADGRSSKRLDYNATYHTNKMRIIMTHDAGIKCDFLMVFEMFKE